MAVAKGKLKPATPEMGEVMERIFSKRDLWMGIVNSKNIYGQEAEDVFHDAIFRFNMNMQKGNFKLNTNESSYFYMTLHSSIVNFHRKNVKFKLNSIDMELDYTHPKDEIILKYDYEVYKTTIDSFMKTKKDIIKSIFNYYIQGYKYREISEELNIPIGSVKSAIRNVRIKLKEKYSMDYNGSVFKV